MSQRSLMVLGVALGLLVFAQVLHAEGKEKTAAAKVTGTITSVDAEAGSFVLATADAEITVKVTKKTKYLVNGKKSTMAAALQSGASAEVLHKAGTALKVSVTIATDDEAPADDDMPAGDDQ